MAMDEATSSTACTVQSVITEDEDEIENVKVKIEKVEKDIKDYEKRMDVVVGSLDRDDKRLGLHVMSQIQEKINLLSHEKNKLVSKLESILSCGPKPKRPRYCCEPAPLPHDPSSTSVQDIEQRTTRGDVYHHWFAVAMYNLKRYLEGTDLEGSSQYSFTFLDMEMQISDQPLKMFVDVWNQIQSCIGELPITAGLAVELQRCLFPYTCGERPAGSCLHQMSAFNCGDGGVSDFCILPYPTSGYYKHNTFVAMSDFKCVERGKSSAYVESIAHCLKQQKGSHHLVRIVFPMTKQRVRLCILVPIEKEELVITVFDSSRESFPFGSIPEKQLKIFVIMLYSGVHYLLAHPIASPHGWLCPTKELKLDFLLEKCTHVLIDESETFVYKLYDTRKKKPQETAAKLVLKDVEVKDITTDGGYCYMKYRYTKGDHRCLDSKCFKGIIRQVARLHDSNLVHSDIRHVNIVYGENPSLIDFDLAGAPYTDYPDSYNHVGIRERHSDARAGRPRMKTHDIFALNEIMKSYGFTQIFFQYCMGVSLYEIANSYE